MQVPLAFRLGILSACLSHAIAAFPPSFPLSSGAMGERYVVQDPSSSLHDVSSTQQPESVPQTIHVVITANNSVDTLQAIEPHTQAQPSTSSFTSAMMMNMSLLATPSTPQLMYGNPFNGPCYTPVTLTFTPSNLTVCTRTCNFDADCDVTFFKDDDNAYTKSFIQFACFTFQSGSRYCMMMKRAYYPPLPCPFHADALPVLIPYGPSMSVHRDLCLYSTAKVVAKYIKSPYTDMYGDPPQPFCNPLTPYRRHRTNGLYTLGSCEPLPLFSTCPLGSYYTLGPYIPYCDIPCNSATCKSIGGGCGTLSYQTKSCLNKHSELCGPPMQPFGSIVTSRIISYLILFASAIWSMLHTHCCPRWRMTWPEWCLRLKDWLLGTCCCCCVGRKYQRGVSKDYENTYDTASIIQFKEKVQNILSTSDGEEYEKRLQQANPGQGTSVPFAPSAGSEGDDPRLAHFDDFIGNAMKADTRILGILDAKRHLSDLVYLVLCVYSFITFWVLFDQYRPCMENWKMFMIHYINIELNTGNVEKVATICILLSMRQPSFLSSFAVNPTKLLQTVSADQVPDWAITNGGRAALVLYLLLILFAIVHAAVTMALFLFVFVIHIWPYVYIYLALVLLYKLLVKVAEWMLAKRIAKRGEDLIRRAREGQGSRPSRKLGESVAHAFCIPQKGGVKVLHDDRMWAIRLLWMYRVIELYVWPEERCRAIPSSNATGRLLELQRHAASTFDTVKQHPWFIVRPEVQALQKLLTLTFQRIALLVPKVTKNGQRFVKQHETRLQELPPEVLMSLQRNLKAEHVRQRVTDKPTILYDDLKKMLFEVNINLTSFETPLTREEIEEKRIAELWTRLDYYDDFFAAVVNGASTEEVSACAVAALESASEQSDLDSACLTVQVVLQIFEAMLATELAKRSDPKLATPAANGDSLKTNGDVPPSIEIPDDSAAVVANTDVTSSGSPRPSTGLAVLANDKEPTETKEIKEATETTETKETEENKHSVHESEIELKVVVSAPPPPAAAESKQSQREANNNATHTESNASLKENGQVTKPKLSTEKDEIDRADLVLPYVTDVFFDDFESRDAGWRRAVSVLGWTTMVLAMGIHCYYFVDYVEGFDLGMYRMTAEEYTAQGYFLAWFLPV